MTILKTFTAAVIAAGTIAAATPANAVITTFAQYGAVGSGANIYWKNNGTGGTQGTGGSIYTISAGNSTVPGSAAVSFSFLQASIAPYVTDVAAAFTLSASVTNTPATLTGGFLIEPGISGTFSFISTAPITVGSNFFAVGSNLLSGTFSTAAIAGQRNGTAGAFAGSAPQSAAFTYTSDFLSFVPGANLDFSLSLTAIRSALQAIPSTGTPNRALRTFRATSTGSFSSDPAPIVTAVPEPAVWGLMIVGFGMVGFQGRRRSRKTSVTA